jgi:hypothetical protein
MGPGKPDDQRKLLAATESEEADALLNPEIVRKPVSGEDTLPTRLHEVARCMLELSRLERARTEHIAGTFMRGFWGSMTSILESEDLWSERLQAAIDEAGLSEVVRARIGKPSEVELGEAGRFWPELREAVRIQIEGGDAQSRKDASKDARRFRFTLEDIDRSVSGLRKSARKIRKAKQWARLQAHLDGLDRYHGAGALVMTAGSIGMIVTSCLSIGPLWAGFLVGALPTFMFTTLVHPEHA